MAILPLQLARVSNTLRTSITQSSITGAQAQLLRVQNELSTGKRLIVASDDPGDAAVAQQIRKLLEQRQAYADNLQRAGNQLGQVDVALGDLSTLVQQAQTLASANVGSDVTPDARANAATIVQSLYQQLLGIGNTKFDGVYLFGGDRATDPPFVETNGGVQFVGGTNLLKNSFDEGAVLPFMADGSAIFGALSSRVEGSVDLSPTITATTRIRDLNGAAGSGVNLGSIQIGDGTNSGIVDLSSADTIGDVINLINAAGIGTVTASISGSATGLQLSAGGSDNITVSEVGGGTTANDLGILNNGGAGVGTPLTGSSVQARVTALTPLANLRGGAGIDTTNGLIITNGLTTRTIDLSAATTVEDLLNAINGSGAAVRAEINSAGNGINLLNPTQGTNMTIGENGGTTAADLGLRSFSASSPLAELNFGKGVRTVQGNDIQIADSAGTTFQVDLDGLTTVQDVIDAINTAAGTASAGVIASFATTGNGIVLTDTAGGGGTLTLTGINYSLAAQDLGLTNPASGGVITGSDVDAVEPSGIFSHLAALRNALLSNDQAAITAAGGALQEDYDRVVRIRGETGVRIQDIEARQSKLEDQNVATKSLLSSLEDVDFTDAISRFQTLQTTLQASLQTSGRLLQLSLLDFLG